MKKQDGNVQREINRLTWHHKSHNKDKYRLSSTKCGNCGCRIDLEWLSYQPATDTKICLCRYCEA